MCAYTNPTWLKEETPHLLEIQNTAIRIEIFGRSGGRSQLFYDPALYFSATTVLSVKNLFARIDRTGPQVV
jgi:hypothetical protein